MSREFVQALNTLYDDVDDELKAAKGEDGKIPLLAHYTSLEVIEKIIRDNLLWFSNPMFMNDRAEVTFGMETGIQTALANQAMRRSLKSDANVSTFNDALRAFYGQFSEKHLIDTYVFCLSRHDENNTDVLSMWRAYGGRGTGAAIVFDPNALSNKEETPFIAAPVAYRSPADQQKWMESLVHRAALIFEKSDYTARHAIDVAWHFFNRLLIYALFTKHYGFREEQEWRIVYLKIRDPQDTCKPMRKYLNGPRGIEPKLHFAGEGLKSIDGADIKFDRLIKSIIIGPTNAYALAQQSFCRMLELLDKSHLVNSVCVSRIPLRPL